TGRGAKRGPRDPAHLTRARGDPLAVGPNPRPLRGRDRRRAHGRGLGGSDRAGDARRRAPRGRVMTSPATPQPSAEASPPGERPPERTMAAPLALRQRAGGAIVPAFTVLLAFLIGGAVVAATGHNPLIAYRDIFNGAGLNWIFHPSTDTVRTDSYNLSQTLLQTTSLILTGLAVAFAFKCGMFNIGGQGQYFAGLYVASWLGHDWAGLNPGVHIFVVIVLATLAGAAWAGIAGVLKATAGVHEVISTIMLN